MDEEGELILCADCVKSGLYGGVPDDTAPAPPPKKNKVEGKEKQSASSSSSSSSVATGGESKVKPLGSGGKRSATRPRVANNPARPINSYDSLLDWCISRYYDTRLEGAAVSSATVTAAGGGSATLNVPVGSPEHTAPRTPLDALVAQLPEEVKALLMGKPRLQTPKPPKSRKGANPRKLPGNINERV
jgi:hypothetical protein